MERISFNFTRKCNLQCGFCYIPFDAEAYSLPEMKAVLRRACELGFKIITFGGGDPFLYGNIIDVLKFAKKLGLIVHVDTNGLALNQDQYRHLEGCVDLLAFPLEGVSRKIHADMRGSPYLFDIVTNHVSSLAGRIPKIKINTVVSAVNVGEIAELGAHLKNLRISIWSLYELWEIEGIGNDYLKFRIDESKYHDICSKMHEQLPEIQVEIGDLPTRSHYYFLTNHRGRVYTAKGSPPTAYQQIGSIFDGEIIERWKSALNYQGQDLYLHRYASKQRQI